MSEPQWTNEETFRFIELYQNEPSIWNPKNKCHKDKNRVSDAWKRIAEAMSIPVQELKKKKDSLLAAFRANHKKVQSSISSTGEELFKPVWIYYDAIASFMCDIYKCPKVLVKTEDEEPSIDEDTADENQADAVTNIPMHWVDANRRVQRPVLKRRFHKPAKLAETQKQMNTALSTLIKVLNNPKENESDNECDMYGRLLAHKLKSYSDIERQELMYEIDGLLLKKRKRNVIMYSGSPSEIMLRSPSSSP